MVSTPLTAQWTISRGDAVVTADGYRLGDVAQADVYEIEVEHGLFFRRRYVITLEEVERYENGTLFCRLTLDDAQAREQR